MVKWSLYKSLYWSSMQGIVGGKLKLKGIDKEKKYAASPSRCVHLDSLLHRIRGSAGVSGSADGP